MSAREPEWPPKLRVLLVDDYEFVREALRRMLEGDSHTVVAAADGPEALGLFQAGSFDVVITDLNMPGMKGDALAAAARSARIHPQAPNQPHPGRGGG